LFKVRRGRKMRSKRRVRFALRFGLLAVLGLAFVMAGCVLYTDGTITAQLVDDLDAYNLAYFDFYVFPQFDDPYTDTPVGWNKDQIVGAVAEATALDFLTGSFIEIYPGGDDFFVLGWIDANFNQAPDTGEPYGLSSVFTVNGDTFVSFDSSTFGLYP
jgi:hypothetical protein